MCKEGLGPILGRVILIVRDKYCHLYKFIGDCYSRIIDLFILRRVWEFDNQIHYNSLKWKGRTIDWLQGLIQFMVEWLIMLIGRAGADIILESSR